MQFIPSTDPVGLRAAINSVQNAMRTAPTPCHERRIIEILAQTGPMHVMIGLNAQYRGGVSIPISHNSHKGMGKIRESRQPLPPTFKDPRMSTPTQNVPSRPPPVH